MEYILSYKKFQEFMMEQGVTPLFQFCGEGTADIGRTEGLPRVTGGYPTVRYGTLDKFQRSSASVGAVVDGGVIVFNRYIPGDAGTPARYRFITVRPEDAPKMAKAMEIAGMMIPAICPDKFNCREWSSRYLRGDAQMSELEPSFDELVEAARVVTRMYKENDFCPERGQMKEVINNHPRQEEIWRVAREAEQVK